MVLSGRIAIFVDRGGGRHKIMEWREGDVTGLLPYSRMVSPPSDTVAQEPSAILAVHRDHFDEMIRECHGITSVLVHTMIDRARVFTSSGLHDEKMVSLGKLSAGLAHELNNPASAIERSAALLESKLEEAERATRAFGAARLTDAQLAAVDTVRASCVAARVPGVLSPLERANREETIADWLADHGLDPATVPFWYSMWTAIDHSCDAASAETTAGWTPISAVRAAAKPPANNIFFMAFNLVSLDIVFLLCRRYRKRATKPASTGQSRALRGSAARWATRCLRNDRIQVPAAP